MQFNGIVKKENGYVEIFSPEASPLRLVDDITYHAPDNLVISWKKFHVKIHEPQFAGIPNLEHLFSILTTANGTLLSSLAGIKDAKLNKVINKINQRFQEALASYRADYQNALKTDYDGWRYEKWKAYLNSDFYFPYPWDQPVFNQVARVYNFVKPVFQRQGGFVDQLEGSHSRCLWMNTISVRECHRLGQDYQDVLLQAKAISNSVKIIKSEGDGPEKVMRLTKYSCHLKQLEQIRMFEFPNKKILLDGLDIPRYIISVGLPSQ